MSTHLNRLVSTILHYDMECVLTRENILATIEGMKYQEAITHLTEWAIRLYENAEYILNYEYGELD